MKKYENRIIIVTRATRLDNLLSSQNTVSQARFYVKQMGSDFAEYEEEHRQYGDSLSLIRRALEELGNIQILDRKFLPTFIFAPGDIVVAVGQDGLVANTMKYLDGQPLIGVNPDPRRWDGLLLPFETGAAAKIVEETIQGKRRFEEVTMAKAKLQNGQELIAVNDFFIGQKSHTSARYVIKFDGLKENQSSSGIIVSTGLGSTGWMKSILAGASRINASVVGRPYGAGQERDGLTEVDEEKYGEGDVKERRMEMMEMAAPAEVEYDAADIAAPDAREAMRNEAPMPVMYLSVAPEGPAGEAQKAQRVFKKAAALGKRKKSYGPTELSKIVGKWSSGELIFAVREPFPSKTTGTNLIFGAVSRETPLRIESLMGENGVIFSDGIESDYLSFNSGAEALITLADRRGVMVV